MEKNYSVEEAAKLLGYSRNSIYSFLKDGDIKSVRIGKGMFRIPQSEIDRFTGGNSSRLEDKRMVEEVVKEAKEQAQPDEPTPLVLPMPRPGKSLEELGGRATTLYIEVVVRGKSRFSETF